MASTLGPSGKNSVGRPFVERSWWMSPVSWAVAYTLFVIYGSLLPFDLRPISLMDAWARFRDIPYLVLSSGARADWIANGVLYFFLALLWSATGLRRRHAMFPVISIWVGCCALAVGIEFAQVFISPRTVSRNDLVAEAIGAAAGILMWRFSGSILAHLVQRISSGGSMAFRSAILAYLIGYAFFSFFPFDFAISGAELSAKLQSKNSSFFLAAACENTFRCLAKFAAEALAILPLGLLMALGRGDHAKMELGSAVLVGVLIGILLETAQLFLLSGVSQGLSVLTRALGVGAGFVLLLGARKNTAYWLRLLRPLVLFAAPFYAIALFTLNGWVGGSWLSLSEGINRLSGISFLPFYYHYYTTEQAAMVSLLSRVAMYAPIGVAISAWRVSGLRGQHSQEAPPLKAAWWALITAAIFETGRLFIAEARPDPTNLLIAALAAGFLCAGVSRAFRWWLGSPMEGSSGRAARRITGNVPAREPATTARKPKSGV